MIFRDNASRTNWFSKLEGFFIYGGIALIVVLIGSLGMMRSTRYYGTLLHGFDAQFYYAAARSLVNQGEFDVTDDIEATPHPAPFQSEHGIPLRPDGGVKNVFPVGLSLIEASFLWPAQRFLRSPSERAPQGYSPAEIHGVAFGLLLVTAVGLQLLHWMSLTMISPVNGAYLVLIAWWGTPLLYYSAWFPFSAHPT